MAQIEDIAKAKLYSYALQKTFGARPDLDIHNNYVRIYYKGQNLLIAQKQFENMISKKPGNIRVDMTNVLMNPLIKKYGIYLILFLIGGMILGKQID